MFARVADRYDLANRVLSMGVDRGWRRAAVRMAEAGSGDRVLDVCTGTGDLSIDLSRTGAQVVGADFTLPMLRHTGPKVAAQLQAGDTLPRFVAGDAMNLPFADHSFDLCTVAFGIRNVEDPLAGLREMRRVLRPGGRVLVLEFCKPRTPVIGPLYMFYFRRVLPRLGRMISGDTGGAYSYLPASVMAFPEREAFLDLLQQAGFTSPRQRILTCGIAALYRAENPA